MPDEQSNEYTYIVRIYGEQAAADARRIRTAIVSEFIQGERQMAAAVQQTLELISSQTRRLSYNATRIREVTGLAQSFATAWARTIATISGGGTGTFDKLVADARRAYTEIAGQSIFTDLYRDILSIYQKIASASSIPFAPLAQQAQAAAAATKQQIVGVTDAAGRLRWPAGTEIGGKKVGGFFTSTQQIDAYNAGLLRLNDIMPNAEAGIAAANVQLAQQAPIVNTATGYMTAFTDQLNIATLQYFGLRRLGYGLEQIGSQMARAGERNVDAMISWARAYAEFNGVATRAAAAMEMNVDQQRQMEDAVLADTEAMRLFDPADIIEGLRVWAAGTGLVVRNEEQLQAALQQTKDIQLLAAFGAEALGETMTGVGGALAEFGLGIDDVDRVTKVFNFTAAKTFAEISDVTQAFRLVGPIAHSYGISLEEAAATMGLLSDENIKGTMAGRAFRQILVQMAKPTADHTKLLNKALGLNEELGESWQQLVFPDDEFIGLASYIDLLASATENLGDQQRKTLLATMATTNELPALTALIDLQTEARKDGINVINAWTKWMVGAVDEEVEALVGLVSRTRGIEMDVTSNMFSFWQQQSDLFYESEQAKANELERRWEAMQLSLGRIVLEEGAPVLDLLMEQLEKIVQFAAEHPGLVTGLMVGAAAEIVLGNLIQLAGQMLGVVANYLILKGAFSAFGGAVGTFHIAVEMFSQAVGADIAGRRTGTAATGAGTLGLFGILARLLPTAALILGVDQPSKRQQEYESLLETLRNLNITAEQWDRLFQDAQLRWQDLPGPEYGRAREMVTPEGKVLDVRGVLEVLESMEALTAEQQEFLDELRSADMAVEVNVEDLPPEIQDMLDGTAEGTFTIWPSLGAGFDPVDIQAVEMYNAMEEALAEVVRKGREKVRDLHMKYNAANLAELEKYNDKRLDITRKYNQKEQDYWEDHLDKLRDIEEDGLGRLDDERKSYAERLEEIRSRALERVAEITEQANTKEADLRAEHLKKMQRMEEDHRDTLVDLAIKRDAYGIWREMRDYGKRSRRAEEDYQDRLRQLQEENKKRINEIRLQAGREEAELKKQHDARMQKIKDDIQERLDAENESYDKAAKRRKRDFDRQLKELKKNYDDQFLERRRAFEEQLKQLEMANLQEYRELRDAKTQELLMLKGMYDEGLQDYQDYFEERLRMLNDYLERERAAMDAQPAITPPEPVDGGGNGTGGGGGGGGGARDGRILPYLAPIGGPGPAAGGRVTVEGNLNLDVKVDGELPEGAEAELRKGIEAMFTQVVRDLEVEYA